MNQYWASIDGVDAATSIRNSLVGPHADLYNTDYVDLPAGSRWEALVVRERTYALAHRRQIEAVDRYLSVNVPRFMAAFHDRFGDFRCDFTLYIAPTFGQMDGSAAFVGGQHRIVFAPDVIPRYHDLAGLKLLIDHETFHIYHHQATGQFGASAEAVPTVIEALWGEGLATFVSWRMNPQMSLDAALLQPGIPDGARPHLAEIARALLADLDGKNASTFGRYFVAGKQPAGYPPRAGYYVGVLLAREFAVDRSLPELAHLQGSVLEREVRSALQRMAASP